MPRKPKREKIDVLEGLIDAIQATHMLPLTEIAHRAGLDLRTAKRSVEIILMIQSKPRVYEAEVGKGRGRQKGYRKHSKR